MVFTWLQEGFPDSSYAILYSVMQKRERENERKLKYKDEY